MKTERPEDGFDVARKFAIFCQRDQAAKGEFAIFVLRANKNKLEVLGREPITSGSVNVYMARFEFSPDWQGLTRKAVFKAGKESRAVLLDESGQCVIPWEVLTSHGQPLMAGVFGTADETALPTTWVSLGTILEGVPGDGEGSKPPTPDLWEQELDRKGDTLAYDGLNLSLKSGDKTLSSVEIAGGGGGGASDHRLLTGRDAAEQHPINSITGLSARLDQTMSKGDALTVQEILKIMEVS